MITTTTSNLLESEVVASTGTEQASKATKSTPTPIQYPLTAVGNIRKPLWFNRLMLKVICKILPIGGLRGVNVIHFARFLLLKPDKNGKPTQFAIVTAYDGSFFQYMVSFLDHPLNILDVLLPWIEGGRKLLMVFKHEDGFVSWLQSMDLKWEFWFSAYPNMNVLAILENPAAASAVLDPLGLQPPVQSPLTAVANILEPLEENVAKLRAAIKSVSPIAQDAFAEMRTIHFARLVFLAPNEKGVPTQLGFITTYDGSFYQLVDNLSHQAHDVFDPLLPYLEGGDRLTSIEKHSEAFGEWLQQINILPVSGWYSAYPNMNVVSIQNYVKDHA